MGTRLDLAFDFHGRVHMFEGGIAASLAGEVAVADGTPRVQVFDLDGRLPSIVPDERSGGRTAARALIEAGHEPRRFALDLNIISGRVDEIGGEPFGLMALAAYGHPAHIAQGVAWMRQLHLEVDDLEPPLAGEAAA